MKPSTHPPHHIHRLLPNLVHERIPEPEADTVFACNGAVELYGSPLYFFGDELRDLVFARGGAYDGGVEIACLGWTSGSFSVLVVGVKGERVEV